MRSGPQAAMPCGPLFFAAVPLKNRPRTAQGPPKAAQTTTGSGSRRMPNRS